MTPPPSSAPCASCSRPASASAAGTPEAAFLGASPELLLRRSGAGASTVALAGSTRRSSDPAVDDHLGEQLLRSDKDRHEQRHRRRADRAGAAPALAVWVEAAPEPEMVKVANIQHLATPIIAQLAEPRSAIELAGLLHPTPAVGGEPWPQAAPAIAELERMDRGWYAGPVGWMDADRGRRVLRRPAQRPAARPRGAPLRRGRRRRRLRPRRRAGGDRGQARGAAAAAQLSAAAAASLRRRCRSTLARRSVRDLDQAGPGGERIRAARRASRAAVTRGRRARRRRPRRRRGASRSARSNSSSASAPAWGRKWKMPPPSLSTTTMRTGVCDLRAAPPGRRCRAAARGRR